MRPEKIPIETVAESYLYLVAITYDVDVVDKIVQPSHAIEIESLEYDNHDRKYAELVKIISWKNN